MNYVDAAVRDQHQAHFAANAGRLAAITQHYDPDRLFPQPQSV